MSIFSHYINRLIRFLGAWMLPLCMLFACTPSRHETSSPQTAETNPYTDSLLQFKIYLEQIRISRFKADTLEEARTLGEAERMARFLNDSASYADLWQEKALFYLPKNPETAKTYFRKALAYMSSGTTASTVQNELYLSRIYQQQKQTDSAFHYINEAIHKNLSEAQTPVLHTQKGYIFASLLKADSATHYILPSLQGLTLKQRTEAYRRLFEMYGNLRDGKRENAYMRKYILSHDSLSTERKEMVIGKIQDMQEYKLQRERANKAEMETEVPRIRALRDRLWEGIRKNIPEVYRILQEGSRRAEKVAARTLAEVKAAMKINYFDDQELIQSQARRFGEN